MIQFMKSGNFRSEPDKVKIEIEDSLEEEHGPFHKRSKPSINFQQHHGNGTENDAFTFPPSQYNPLDEPSPLGLRLRKSPSLLELIQMKLSQSQGHTSSLGAATGEYNSSGLEREAKISSSSMDKLKASNFAASLLKIGSWEYVSRYEGDLVAKCYFAKHKLVWEVLEGGLKSKIEIQWSDIMGLTASCPDNGPGTLKVVLARQPLFYRETNPQPRKHTLWQATADFTDGQASTHRIHFLKCPHGQLNKHFEKLIQCDTRLNFLSRKPEISLESPYFEKRSSVFAELSESKSHGFDQPNIGLRSTSSGFHDVASPQSTLSSSFKFEQHDIVAKEFEHMSPASRPVMDKFPVEGNGITVVDSHYRTMIKKQEHLKGSGLHSSMSMSDLVNHIGHRISEQITSGNPSPNQGLECRGVLDDIAQCLLSDSHQFTPASDERSVLSCVNSLCCLLQKSSEQKDPSKVQEHDDGNNVLENLAQYLLSDSQFVSASDEKSVMSRVNSLCCLLQKEPDTVQKLHTNGEGHDGKSDFREVSAMSRKDSFGDLLLHLPRIASLPKFLFDISEDGESRHR